MRTRALRLQSVRKIPAVLALTALAGFSLVACAPASDATSSPDCTREPANDAVATAVEVTGEYGDAPSLSLHGPFTTDRTVYTDVEEGDGRAIEDLDQPSVLEMSFFSAETGDPIIGTAYGDDAPTPTSTNRWLEMFPGLEDALLCALQGTRTVVALAEDGVADATRAQYAMNGFPQEGGVIAVVDLRRVYPTAAWGSPVYNADTGLPSVVRDPQGRPGVTVPDAQPPADLVVQTLLEGDGPVIGEDDTAVVQYTGVLWDEKTVFDSSWDNGSLLMAVPGGMIEGFEKALQGQKVGSQVMAVIPPELGYGEEGSGAAIPGGATLVFVIDIVGVEETPAS